MGQARLRRAMAHHLDQWAIARFAILARPTFPSAPRRNGGFVLGPALPLM